MVQGAGARPPKPHERRPALVHGSSEATPPPVSCPFLQAPARRSCDVLDALPLGRDKEGGPFFALPFCAVPTLLRSTAYEAAPECAKGFPTRAAISVATFPEWTY